MQDANTDTIVLRTTRPMRPSDYSTPEHNVPALVYAFALTVLLTVAVCVTLGLL